jgi:hypothetical protein
MNLNFTITNSSCRSPERPSTPRKTKLRTKFASEFVKMYDMGNLPLKTEPFGMGLKIAWTCERFEDLDYLNLIPLFLKGMFLSLFNLVNVQDVYTYYRTGICADRDPHRFVATEGLLEMVEERPNKVLKTIPSVCKILKSMAQMKNADISHNALRFLQELIVCHREAPTLIVKHLGVLLPVLNPMSEKQRKGKFFLLLHNLPLTITQTHIYTQQLYQITKECMRRQWNYCICIAMKILVQSYVAFFRIFFSYKKNSYYRHNLHFCTSIIYIKPNTQQQDNKI